MIFAEGVIERFASLDRVLIAVLATALAATCLLVSAGEGGVKIGYRPWREGSLLHALVTVLAMNHQYPTRSGAEIKWLAQGLGGAGLILAATLGWYVRTRREDDLAVSAHRENSSVRSAGLKTRISLVGASQLTMLLLGIWAALSALWAPWPQAALGEAVRQSILIGGAVALGRALSHRAVPAAAGAMVAVLTAASIIGLWHHYERSPVLRLEFPIGNPLFMAACLIPGILLGAALLLTIPTPAAGRPPAIASADTGRNRRRALGTFAALACGLTITGWAFVLTGSRSPAVGLGCGAVAMVWLLGGRRLRRAVAGMAVVALLAGALWLYARAGDGDSGRSASFRMRLYAWTYAVEMFLGQPLTGHGQAAYLLKSQAMSRADAEQDAAAFVAELFGRAHNEWLETLAELGAVGLALAGVSLGTAIWATASAVRRLEDRRLRWCAAAGAAALAALIVEECADVALRKPGLPIVFHAVLGLTWSLGRRNAVPWVGDGSARSGALRAAGLVAGTAVSLAAVWAHVADWRGALAEMSAVARGDKGDWAAALREADRASGYRLTAEDRLSAGYQSTRLALIAAQRQLERIEGLVRAAEEARKIQPGLRGLAREDAARFREYFQFGAAAGTALLQRMPAYPSIAEMLAEGWLGLEALEAAERALELRSDAGSYRETARQWLRLENSWFPLRARTALRLASLSEDRPVAERLDVLRVALRGGPEPPAVQASFERALAGLLTEQDFQTAASDLLNHIRQARAEPDDRRWTDPYAPESLRLLATASVLIGRMEQAAAMARDAVELYDRPRFRRCFPGLRNRAQIELARWMLLARPADAAAALEVCRAALADWPVSAGQEEWLAEARRELVLLLLAANREDEAAHRLTVGEAPESGEPSRAVRESLAGAYCALSRRFERLPPASQPAEAEQWTRRALELDPSSADALVISLRMSLARGRENEVGELLERLRGALRDDERMMVEIVQSLLNEFPESRVLRSFLDGLIGENPDSQTEP